ncbi:MAG: adenylate/guanylate cyclase domain-containing protein, partial [Dactylosporangium sp.]|nr:adenylate/guanylate cyclase domain-containing protein [Dactylosporangium sp.]NNJ62838.1 adenylate/guanylate cyclase domain-containing protein [Dactylosporangium sp.]
GGREPASAEIADLERIAAGLDGLPLALELAAARLRVLAPAQLAARIEDVLCVLDAGGEAEPPTDPAARHQTIRAAVAWSYRTLGPSEAWLLRRLSVFAGAVELSAIEWLHDGDPLAPLATLVDKSMVQVEPGRSGATYRMLDPIRAFAAKRLAEAGEEPEARGRQIDWCLRSVSTSLGGVSAAVSLYALDPLAEEFRAALRWTVSTGEIGGGFAIVSGLRAWWCERGLAREGRMWLFRLYDRMGTTGGTVPDAELAEAYHTHAVLAGSDGEHGEALRFLDQAEDVARRCGDPALSTRIMAFRGPALMGLGRHDEAERTCRDVIALAQRQGLPGEALFAVYALAELLWRRGALDRAAALLATARPIEAAQPPQRGRRTVDMILGLVALSRGDLVAAHEYLLVALRSRMRHGFHARAGEALSAIAVRCALGGEPEMAARLFGAAQAARARMHCAPGTFGSFWADHHGAVRERLGDATFDATYAEGGGLDLEEAGALALTVEHPDLVAGSVRFRGGSPSCPPPPGRTR